MTEEKLFLSKVSYDLLVNMKYLLKDVITNYEKRDIGTSTVRSVFSEILKLVPDEDNLDTYKCTKCGWQGIPREMFIRPGSYVNKRPSLICPKCWDENIEMI